MAELTIHIPDGLDDTQRAELSRWLADQAAAVSAAKLDAERDPAFRAEAIDKIRRGRAEIDAGHGLEAGPSLRRIAEEFGIDLPR